jgi:hypothetical protein
MNGATEATLQELLAIAQSMNGNLIKLNSMFASFQKAGGMGNAGASGGGASSALNSAATAASGFTKALNPVGLALSAVQGAAFAVGKVLGVMADMVGAVIDGVAKTIGALVKFSLQATLGEAKLSDFYKALSDVPLLGKLFSFFGDIVAMQERVLGSYQSVAKSGASFSGNLTDLQQAAARSYMSLDSFVATVGKSGETFVLMSGNMQEGVRRFVDTQHKLLDPNGPYAQSIAGLGYTAEDTAAAMQSVIRSQGIMTGKNSMNNDQLAKATRDYMEDLDQLAKITGKRRDQIQAEVDEAQADQAYQLFLDSITDPTEKQKIMSHVQQQVALYGKTGGDIAKNAVRGIMVPMNEAQTQLMTFNRGIMDVNAQANRSIKDRSITDEQFKKNMGQANYTALKETGAMFKSMGPVTTALASGMYPAINVVIAAQRQAAAAGYDFAKSQDIAKKAQQEQYKGTAGALKLSEDSIKGFGSEILKLISIVLRPLMSILTGWTGQIQELGETLSKDLEEPVSKFAQFMTDTIVPTLRDIGAWFSETFKQLKESKPGEFWNTLGDRLKDGFAKIWKVVEPVLASVWKSIEPVVVKAFEKLFGALMQAIKDYFGIGETSNDKEWKRQTEDAGSRNDAFGKAFQTYLQNQRNAEAEATAANPEAASQSMSEVDVYKQWRASKEGQQAFDALKASSSGKEANPRDRRAGGGFVSPGSYLVGEKGPEVLNVGSNGDVITNENLTRLLAMNGQQNNSQGELTQLNKLVAELIRINREQRDINKQHLDAIKSLNGNLFLA